MNPAPFPSPLPSTRARTMQLNKTLTTDGHGWTQIRRYFRPGNPMPQSVTDPHWLQKPFPLDFICVHPCLSVVELNCSGRGRGRTLQLNKTLTTDGHPPSAVLLRRTGGWTQIRRYFRPGNPMHQSVTDPHWLEKPVPHDFICVHPCLSVVEMNCSGRGRENRGWQKPSCLNESRKNLHR
jgi:hypothetical protein